MVATSVIALYSKDLGLGPEQHSARPRRRKDGMWTQVECEIIERDGRFVAVPRCEVPDDAPLPAYRARLELERDKLSEHGMAVVVKPLREGSPDSPEERLLAPLYQTRERIVFEFNYGEVVFVQPDGSVEVRLIAIDRDTGTVGTETQAYFHMRWASIAARCQAHLAGTANLFPPIRRQEHASASVPSGRADLTFGTWNDRKGSRRQ